MLDYLGGIEYISPTSLPLVQSSPRHASLVVTEYNRRPAREHSLIHTCAPKKPPVLPSKAVATGVLIKTPVPAAAYSMPNLVPMTAMLEHTNASTTAGNLTIMPLIKPKVRSQKMYPVSVLTASQQNPNTAAAASAARRSISAPI